MSAVASVISRADRGSLTRSGLCGNRVTPAITGGAGRARVRPQGPSRRLRHRAHFRCRRKMTWQRTSRNRPEWPTTDIRPS